jgi:hypothetical protein
VVQRRRVTKVSHINTAFDRVIFTYPAVVRLLARFLPPSSPPPNTHIHLSFSSIAPGTSLLPLSLLQVSAYPLAVIGVSDLSDTKTNHNQKVGAFQKVLRDLQVDHANGTIYPLARRCFGVEEDVSAFPLGSTPRAGNFPPENKSTPNLSDSSSDAPRRVAQSATFQGMVEIDASDGSNIRRPKSEMANRDQKMYDRKGYEERMVVIPKDGNVEIVMGMLMADVVASVLTEFGDIVSHFDLGILAEGLSDHLAHDRLLRWKTLLAFRSCKTRCYPT